MNSLDPTRLMTTRRMFLAELMARYRHLKRDIQHLVVTENAFALGHVVLTRFAINARWRWEHSDGKVKRFREWLRYRLDTQLAGDKLIAHYIEQAYTKGATRSYSDVKRGKVVPISELEQKLSDDELSELFDTSTAQYLRDAFSTRATVEKVKLLAGRTFHELEDMNNRMGTKMSRILADGLANQRTPQQIAQELSREVDIAVGRAGTIVRTELTRAHAEGQLDTMERLGVTHVGAVVEWDTANDDKVCPMCKPLEGIILKVSEARGMLPRHPNCRCAWIPASLAKCRVGQIRQKREVQRAIRRSQQQGNDGWESGTQIGGRT